jgi:hypothetical protein
VAPKGANPAKIFRTIVTFADLYRDSPGVITSTEPSFVVLVDDGELYRLFNHPSLFKA